MQATMQARNSMAEKLQFRQDSGSPGLYDIEEPGPNDVLFGRGTGSNMHSGNIRFRALIQKYKPVYRDTPKKMKPSVSTKVVAIWRAQEPPGRFLTRSDRFHGSRRTFYDVGDAMARRKAAQCLREKSTKERLQHQLKAGDKRPLPEEEENVITSTTSLVSSLLNNEPKEAKSGESEEELDLFAGDLLDASASSEANTSNEFLSIMSLVAAKPDDDDKAPEVSSTFSLGSSKVETKNEANEYSLLKNLTLPDPVDLDLKLPDSLKTLASKYKDEASWFACTGAPKQDPLSLVDVYAAETDDTVEEQQQQRDESDSPFMFASFDLGNATNDENDGDNNGGLCFPSLLGNSTETTSSSSFFDDEEEDAPFPSLPSLAAPVAPPALPDKRQDVLQTIRNTMPTAASLTTNLFDL